MREREVTKENSHMSHERGRKTFCSSSPRKSAKYSRPW